MKIQKISRFKELSLRIRTIHVQLKSIFLFLFCIPLLQKKHANFHFQSGSALKWQFDWEWTGQRSPADKSLWMWQVQLFPSWEKAKRGGRVKAFVLSLPKGGGLFSTRFEEEGEPTPMQFHREVENWHWILGSSWCEMLSHSLWWVTGWHFSVVENSFRILLHVWTNIFVWFFP